MSMAWTLRPRLSPSTPRRQEKLFLEEVCKTAEQVLAAFIKWTKTGNGALTCLAQPKNPANLVKARF
jgi:hypothetical protein